MSLRTKVIVVLSAVPAVYLSISFRDTNSQPLLLLQGETPRASTAPGAETIYLALWVLAAVGLVLMIAIDALTPLPASAVNSTREVSALVWGSNFTSLSLPPLKRGLWLGR